MIKLKYLKIVALFTEITMLVFLSLVSYHFLFAPKNNTLFYLPSSDKKTLLRTLEKQHIKIYFIDKILLNFITLPAKGWYKVNPNYGRISFFKNLHKQHIPTMHIKIYAGESNKELITRLSHDTKLNAYTLCQVYKKKRKFIQANILAGTYIIPRHIHEEQLITHLINVSNNKMSSFYHKYLDYTLTWGQKKVLLTIASIIQKESNNPNEMPLISSVIYNRLKKHMRLQMDGTLNYGKYAHTIITKKRIRLDTSKYNTYKHYGVPPEPLSTVTMDAIRAALLPTSTSYLFFMLTTDGTHTFASDYKTHLENINIFKQNQKEKKRTQKKNLKKELKVDTNNTIKATIVPSVK